MMRTVGVGLAGGVLMIALALGYFVLVLVKREDNPFKALGYAIGVFTIVVSGVLLLDKSMLYMLQMKRSCAMQPPCLSGKMHPGLHQMYHKIPTIKK